MPDEMIPAKKMNVNQRARMVGLGFLKDTIFAY
jgi:hypothetical protein